MSGVNAGAERRGATGVCNDFERGECNRAQCKFSHGAGEPAGGRSGGGDGGKPCHDFENGTCKRGDSCKFSHGSAGRGNQQPRQASNQQQSFPQDPNIKCYVGNLPGDIRPDALDYVFRTYGRITDINILPSKAAKGSVAAFISFSHPAEVDAAIMAMQCGYEIRPGHGPITVKRPHGATVPDPTARMPAPIAQGGAFRGGGAEQTSQLFIGNLPSDIKPEALDYVFRTYGRITDIKILPPKGNKDRSVGFVTFSHPAEVDAAIGAMQCGYEIRPGQGPINVKRAGREGKGAGKDSYNNGGGGSYGHAQSNTAQSNTPRGRDDRDQKQGSQTSEPNSKIYIGSLPMDIQEETLRSVFGTYGTVEEVVINPNKPDGGDRLSALIKYSTVDEAEASVEAMQVGYEIRPGQGNIKVRFANNKGSNGRSKPY